MPAVLLLCAITFVIGYLVGMRLGLREGYRRALEEGGPMREAKIIDLRRKH